MVALLLSVSVAMAQPVADGQFVLNFDGSTLEVTVQLQGNPVAKLAQTTLQFSFNETGLSFPASPTKNVDYIYHNYDGFVGGALYSSNVTKIAGGVSVNIDYTSGGEGTGVDLPSSWTNVVTLYFDILSDAEMSDLEWGLVEVFQTPGVPADRYTNGTFADMDVSLDPSLPIEVTSFEATANGKQVRLSWNADGGVERGSFGVQARGQDELEWTTLGTVPGVSGQAGFFRYQTDDLSIGKHRFRLANRDAHGTVTYSNEIEVVVALDTPFVIGSVYPNPLVDRGSFDLSVDTQQYVTVEVYNLLGQRLETVFSDEVNANESVTVVIERGQMPSGTYLIRAQGENFVATRTLSVVK